ncbi:MAG TPA: hypothetical protein VFG20_22475, partial [Planctomycetaceae bacterium]|nr:hypothetical protein [Planctomycetaceae bacterium]
MKACWSIGIVVLITPGVFAADVFDRHIAKDLKRALEQPPVKELSLNDSAKLKRLAASVSSPCIVVKTDDGNYSKALIGWGLRKGGEKPTPVLLIERFVTYRGDRTELTSAAGKDVMLFPGFGFNFDIGQVVPAGQGADIEFTPEQAVKSVGDAVMIALNGSILPAAEKSDKHDPAANEAVVPLDFAGTWKVDVDGRWKGEWDLTVGENGKVTGVFVSDELQNRYDILGQFGSAPNNLRVEILLANAQMQVDGYLWTKDKSQIAGTVTMTNRKFGFHAVR